MQYNVFSIGKRYIRTQDVRKKLKDSNKLKCVKSHKFWIWVLAWEYQISKTFYDSLEVRRTSVEFRVKGEQNWG